MQVLKPLVFGHGASVQRRHQAVFLPFMRAHSSAQSLRRSEGTPQGAQCVLQSHSLGYEGTEAGAEAEVRAEAALAWESKGT